MADLIFAALDQPVAAPAGRHTAGTFKADWRATMTLLDEELDRIHAKQPTLYVDVDPSKITRKGEIFGGIGATRTPGVRLEFLKPTRRGGIREDVEDVRAAFPCARYWTAPHNVRAIALTLQALRAVDRYGATSDAGEQYAGFLRLPGAGGVNTTAVALSPERAARILVEAHPETSALAPYLRDNVAASLLSGSAEGARVFARDAKAAAHPDRGGSTDAFAAVAAAADVVLRHRAAGEVARG